MEAIKRRPLLAGAVAALAAPTISRAWATAQVLKFIPATDLTVLDPIWTTDYRTRNHAFAVFDTLYGQTGPSEGFKATPQMVAGHTIENDGLTWRLTLRSRPDVADSINRPMRPSAHCAALSVAHWPGGTACTK